MSMVLTIQKVSRWLISSSQKKFSKDSIISYVEANNNDPSSLLFGFYLNGQLRGTARLHDANSEYINIGVAVFDVSIWGQILGVFNYHLIMRYYA